MDEIKELRRLVDEAAVLLSNASSGYISGTRLDCEFDVNRDEWVRDAANVRASTHEPS